MPARRPCSAASPGAICGRGARPTGPRPSAASAIRISSARTETAAASLRAAGDLARACVAAAGSVPPGLLVVLTGGEPMLQVDAALIDALHEHGFRIAIETNGTLPVPASIDWICVSPKAGTELKQMSGNELKLVFPQDGLAPEDVAGLRFLHRFLQPMDGADREENTAAVIAYCKAHPAWRLSLQTHKLIGIR